MSRRMFRGYSKQLHKWIYGYYVCDEEGCWERGLEGKAFIVSKNNGIWYEVEKDSVGQSIGLKDKNDVEIYEGDIVKVDGSGNNDAEINEVVFYRGTFCFTNRKKLNPLFTGLNYCCEVIGNTYINPWLLEVDANDE